MNALQRCRWQFSHKETLLHTFFETIALFDGKRPSCVLEPPFGREGVLQATRVRRRSRGTFSTHFWDFSTTIRRHRHLFFSIATSYFSRPSEFSVTSLYVVYSERELVHVRYMSSSVRLSVVCLYSVTFVHPTQALEIFGNISTPSGTLATYWNPRKILRRSSEGNTLRRGS